MKASKTLTEKFCWEMRIACIKDANLQNNFDAFKNKFIEISNKYNRTFENGQDG